MKCSHCGREYQPRLRYDWDDAQYVRTRKCDDCESRDRSIDYRSMVGWNRGDILIAAVAVGIVALLILVDCIGRMGR